MKSDKIIEIGMAAFVAFVVISTILVDNFGTVYEHGFGSSESSDLVNEYCVSAGSLTACSGCNATSGSGYETFLAKCSSLVGRQNNTHCYACSSFGFKTIARGLSILMFVLAIIAVGLSIYRFTKK